MTMIGLICENYSIKFLVILIGMAQLLHIFIVNNIEDKESNGKNRKVNSVKYWMLIIHLIVITCIVISILKIKACFILIALLYVYFNNELYSDN